jgi:hypothetical protein
VDIGRELLAADSRNPRGFFEDLSFLQFHERALLDRGTTPYVGPEFIFEATSAEREEAKRLVSEREGLPLWGWKDPRSSLFLDFWHEILPDARFLFVYRHPLEVLLSLVRRSEAHTAGLLEGLTAWVAYNARILSFREKHPQACLLCHTVTALHHPEDLGHLMTSRLGIQLSLDRSTVESLYHREELKRLPLSNAVETVFSSVHPEAMALYERLDEQADQASERAPDSGGQELEAELGKLSRAVVSFDRPQPAARVRGLLLLLLAALDPKSLERYYEEHGRYVLHLERDRGRLQSALDAEATTVRRQSEWIETVESNNRAKQEWIETQDAAISNQDAALSSQKGWIETLEGNNRAKQEWIEALEANNRAKQEWIEALEADNRAKQQAIDAVEGELKRIQNSDAWRVGRRLAASAPGRLALRLLRRARPEADKEPA